MLRRRQSGFTIIEVLVIIVVIAILAAISIVAYGGVTERAKRTELQTALHNYQTIIQLMNEEEALSLNGAICLGQMSDYPAVDGMAEGECIAADDMPHFVTASVANPPDTRFTKQGTPPSVNASSIAGDSSMRFRGLAIVSRDIPDTGGLTVILYKKPAAGCFDGDELTSSYAASGSSHPLSWWSMEDVCAQPVKDMRINCNNYNQPWATPELLESIGC